MLRAILLKEWWLHRRSFVTTFVVAVTMVVALPGNCAPGLLLFGLVPAIGLGLRFGGEDGAHGTLEFIYSRAVDRRTLIATRFLLGLALVTFFAGLFIAADSLDSYGLFWTSLSEIPPGQPTLEIPPYYVVIATLIFFYALAFFFGSSAKSPLTLALRWLVAIGVGASAFSALLRTTVGLLGLHRSVEVFTSVSGGLLLSGQLALLSSVLYFVTCRRLLEREI